MQVNDQLDKRREQLNKILIFVRICLQVTVIATVINTVATCVEVEGLFVPYSLTAVQFSFEYAFFLIGQCKKALSVLMFALSLAIALLCIIAGVKMKADSRWATLLTVIITADLIITAVLAFARLDMIFYVVDLVLHLLMIIQTMRARRASYGLSVLPEEEYEGDPFEEFNKN